MQTNGELRPLNVDLAAALAQDAETKPRLPPAIMTTARQWLNAGPKTVPNWESFDLARLGEAAAYASVVRCHNDMIFTFVHCGSGLTALLGEDVVGRTVNYSAAMQGEIDWYHRCRPVAKSAQVRLVSGRTNPPYTSGFEFIAADFPFLSQQGDVSHILGITIAAVN